MKKKVIDLIKLLISCTIFLSIGYFAKFILKLLNIGKFTIQGEVIYQVVLSSILFIILFILYNKTITINNVYF